MQLTVASINIERSKHLHRVEKFLNFWQPDVLCIQELCKRDIPFFEDLMGNKLHYAPMCLHTAEEELETIGIGLISWGAMTDLTTHYYQGDGTDLKPVTFTVLPDGHKMANHACIDNAVIAGTYQGFRIATTHLNVTRKGESTPWQRESAEKLVAHAKQQAQKEGGLLLCGDFNAPRGRATFDILAANFVDGVPPQYTTSIDGTLHKSGQVPYMVDGLFHTPSYKLENAALHTGVSDHCALITNLSKA